MNQLDPDAVLAHECTRAYLRELQGYMDAPKAQNDDEQHERNRVLRRYARGAISAIVEHMP